MGKHPAGKEERKFGFTVRKLREANRFTQEAFSKYIGIDRSYEGRIERGEVSVTLSKIGLIARGLGLRPWELFKKAEEKHRK